MYWLCSVKVRYGGPPLPREPLGILLINLPDPCADIKSWHINCRGVLREWHDVERKWIKTHNPPSGMEFYF